MFTRGLPPHPGTRWPLNYAWRLSSSPLPYCSRPSLSPSFSGSGVYVMWRDFLSLPRSLVLEVSPLRPTLPRFPFDCRGGILLHGQCPSTMQILYALSATCSRSCVVLRLRGGLIWFILGGTCFGCCCVWIFGKDLGFLIIFIFIAVLLSSIHRWHISMSVFITSVISYVWFIVLITQLTFYQYLNFFW